MSGAAATTSGWVDLQTVFAVLGAVVVLIAALGAAFAVARANFAQRTIELWREENEALRARVVTLEAAVQAAATRVATLEQSNRVLAEIVRAGITGTTEPSAGSWK
jgi:hypothetical protein